MLLKVFDDHILDATLFDYRENIDGTNIKPVEIKRYTPLLLALRSLSTYIKKTENVKALCKKAIKEEDNWHLAAERDGWVNSQDKRIRSMMRDVAQHVMKAKTRRHKAAPDWVVPFLNNEGHSCDDGEAAAASGSQVDHAAVKKKPSGMKESISKVQQQPVDVYECKWDAENQVSHALSDDLCFMM